MKHDLPRAVQVGAAHVIRLGDGGEKYLRQRNKQEHEDDHEKQQFRVIFTPSHRAQGDMSYIFSFQHLHVFFSDYRESQREPVYRSLKYRALTSMPSSRSATIS